MTQLKPVFKKEGMTSEKLQKRIERLDSDEAQQALVDTLVHYGMFVPKILRMGA